MKDYTLSFVIILLLVTYNLKATDVKIELTILFYNVENLFDTINDPVKLDNEFTPAGQRSWTSFKLHRKQNSIRRAIIASSNYSYPDIIALCEIEKQSLAEDLLQEKIFQKASYKILYNESEDLRGIDIALAYDSTKISIINYEWIKIPLERPSRDILYVSLLYQNTSLNLYVNHWPSRYSGVLESEGSRLIASSVLSAHIDSVKQLKDGKFIIVCGDFNDQSTNQSLNKLINKHDLINLKDSKAKGTIKYQGFWYNFDHFIISKNLEQQIRSFRICNKSFLLEDDLKFGGKKPYRTFNGFKYNGGYSDHLPVLLKIRF